jgi:hypothetical protein
VVSYAEQWIATEVLCSQTFEGVGSTSAEAVTRLTAAVETAQGSCVVTGSSFTYTADATDYTNPPDSDPACTYVYSSDVSQADAIQLAQTAAATLCAGQTVATSTEVTGSYTDPCTGLVYTATAQATEPGGGPAAAGTAAYEGALAVATTNAENEALAADPTCQAINVGTYSSPPVGGEIQVTATEFRSGNGSDTVTYTVCAANGTTSSVTNSFTATYPGPGESDASGTATVYSRANATDEANAQILADLEAAAAAVAEATTLATQAAEDAAANAEGIAAANCSLLNNITVTFNANGGTGAMASETNPYGVAANLVPNTFTNSGFTFTGWSTSPVGAVAYADQASFPFVANTTLYAQWSSTSGQSGTTITVTFNANGGTGAMASETENFNTPTALTGNAFTRTGYTFTGWNTVVNGSGTAYADQSIYPFITSITLYAQWNVAVTLITVTFNANGGTGSMAGESNPYGVAADLVPNAFTNAGYTFTGWNIAVNGSGTAYADQASFPFVANTTLYAQWSTNSSGVVSTGGVASGGTLDAVDCLTATECIAVGYNANFKSIWTLGTLSSNAWSWTSEATIPSDSTGEGLLLAVACPTTTTCIATGGSAGGSTGLGIETIGTLSNGTWSWTPEVDLASDANGGGVLFSIDCVSSTECVAGGDDHKWRGVATSVTLVGGTWTWNREVMVASDTNGGGRLLAMNCPSTTECVAVGNDDTGESNFTIGTKSGATWSWTTNQVIQPDATGYGELDGVACPSTILCIAVGYDNAQEGIESIGTKAGGQWSWTRETQVYVDAVPMGDFAGITCSSTAICSTVGYNGLSEGQSAGLKVLAGVPGFTDQLTITSPGTGSGRLLAISSTGVASYVAVGYSTVGIVIGS